MEKFEVKADFNSKQSTIQIPIMVASIQLCFNYACYLV